MVAPKIGVQKCVDFVGSLWKICGKFVTYHKTCDVFIANFLCNYFEVIDFRANFFELHTNFYGFENFKLVVSCSKFCGEFLW